MFFHRSSSSTVLPLLFQFPSLTLQDFSSCSCILGTVVLRDSRVFSVIARTSIKSKTSPHVPRAGGLIRPRLRLRHWTTISCAMLLSRKARWWCTGTYVENNAGMAGRPVNVSASWPRLVEAGRGGRLAAAGGRPELDLARAGRAGGRIGRRLWAAGLRIAAHHTPKWTRNSQW